MPNLGVSVVLRTRAVLTVLGALCLYAGVGKVEKPCLRNKVSGKRVVFERVLKPGNRGWQKSRRIDLARGCQVLPIGVPAGPASRPWTDSSG